MKHPTWPAVAVSFGAVLFAGDGEHLLESLRSVEPPCPCPSYRTGSVFRPLWAVQPIGPSSTAANGVVDPGIRDLPAGRVVAYATSSSLTVSTRIG